MLHQVDFLRFIYWVLPGRSGNVGELMSGWLLTDIIEFHEKLILLK